MAALYTFDPTGAIQSALYPKQPPTLAKVEKALKAKKIPQRHVDLFLRTLSNYKFNTVQEDAYKYVWDRIVGLRLAPSTKDPNIAQKAITLALIGSQKAVIQAKFDLSVHLKGQNLELHHTDCKGHKKVLFSVAPPAATHT